MDLFAVFQQGFYRHTCVGIFTDYPTAESHADAAAATEPTNYHSYDVHLYELNKPNCETKAVYSVKRNDALAKLALSNKA